MNKNNIDLFNNIAYNWYIQIFEKKKINNYKNYNLKFKIIDRLSKNNWNGRNYMENNELSIAYAEVYEILSFMEPKYIDKIPLKLMELFREEKLKDYKPNIEPTIPLDEQKLQKKTLIILAMLNINYWCEDENEKKELIKLYSENDKRKEEELRERYNPDNLFKKKGQIVEDNKINQEYTQLIEYKEQNIFKKILSKIMKLFKKNN